MYTVSNEVLLLMRTKWFAFSWLALIMFAILGGLLTKLSYKDYNAHAQEKLGSYSVAQLSFHLENIECESVIQLVAESEYIFKVKKIDKSIFLYQTTFTPVRVMHVYKGDVSLTGAQVFIFEPAFAIFETERYYPVSSYNLMLEGKDYLVFLCKRKYPEGYTANDIERNSFIYTTNSALSKYLLNNDFQKEILIAGNDGLIKYDEIKDFEIITWEDEQLDYYNSFKKEVITLYKD